MEKDLTRAEFLMEDGHGMDADMVADEISSLRRMKQDFLDVLDMSATRTDKQTLIHLEQEFDDALDRSWQAAISVAGYDVEWPSSPRYIAWLKERKHA